jgi:hypothetical protein
MRKVTRKRFIAVICYFVATTLSLAPVAHASLVVLDGSVNQSVENGHNCDQQAIDLKNSSTHQHNEHMKGAVTTGCEHGTTCKLLCSASVSVSHEENISALSTINSNRWLPIDISALKSSFLSRLERPPKL